MFRIRILLELQNLPKRIMAKKQLHKIKLRLHYSRFKILSTFRCQFLFKPRWDTGKKTFVQSSMQTSNARTLPPFQRAHVLPLPEFIIFSKLQFTPSCVHDLLPSFFENTWQTNRLRRETEDQKRQRNVSTIC